MKKYIPIIAIILFSFTASLAIAQDNASAVVKGIVKPFREKKNVELSFKYHYVVDGSNLNEDQEGIAYIQGDAYKMLLKEQETICDGTTIWTHFINEEEVVISSTSFGDDNTPLKLFTTIDKYYTATFSDKSTILLSNPEGQVKKVTLDIDPKKGTLKGMTIYVDDTNLMVITITEMKYDQNLKDGFFTFDEKAYPNVDIIDMR